MADRREVIAIISADASKLGPGLAKGKRAVKNWSREVTLEVRRGLGSIGDIVGLGGMAGLIAAGKRVLDFQTRLTRLRISSESTASTMRNLESSIFKAAKARGLDPDDLLAGAEKFTARTGDLQGFIDGLNDVASASAATGASSEDLAMVAATIDQTLGIKAGEWGLSFDLLARGAKKGAVEVKDFAGELVKVAPSFGRFGAKGTEALASMSALFQMGQSGFSNAGEAATGFIGAMKVVERDAKKLGKRGIKVWEKKNGKEQLRDFKSIVDDIMKLDEKTIGKIFGGDMEAKRFVLALKQQAAAYDDLADASKAAGTIAKDRKIWDESPAKKMASAQAKLAEFFNESMKSHIEKAAKALDLVADALGAIVNNWQLLVAALLGKKGIEVVLGALDRFGKGAGAAQAAASGGAGGAGGGGAGGARGSRGDRVAGSILAFGTGYEIGSWINEKTGASKAIVEGLQGQGLGPGAMPILGDTYATAKFDAALRQAQQELGMSRGAAVVERAREIEARPEGADFSSFSGLVNEAGGSPRLYKPDMAAQLFADRQARSRQAADAALGMIDPTGQAVGSLSREDAANLRAMASRAMAADPVGGRAKVEQLLKALLEEVKRRPGSLDKPKDERRRAG